MSALTTWLTAIADAIRGKDGTALPIDHADFPDRIAAISTDAYWQNVKVLYNGFLDSDISGDVKLYIPNITNLYQAFMNCNITSMEISIGDGGLLNGTSLFDGCTNLINVIINGSFEACTSMHYLFYGCVKLQAVTGTPLDLTACTGINSCFYNCTELTTIFFAPSTIKIDISFADSPLLSTASLLSIANGLDASAAPKTLTTHATSKTAMDAISVDVADGVAAIGTTKTLTQFITTDKGWTIS